MQATITMCPFELLCSYYCSILALYISFTIINPMLIRSSSSIVTRTSLQICKPDSKPELSNECNVSRKQRETLVGFRTNVWQTSTYITSQSSNHYATSPLDECSSSNVSFSLSSDLLQSFFVQISSSDYKLLDDLSRDCGTC